MPDVPAFGARRIRCVPGRPPEGPAVSADGRGLTGAGFAVTINPKTGGIAAWRQDGHDFVRTGEPLNAFSRLLGADLSAMVGPSNVVVDVSNTSYGLTLSCLDAPQVEIGELTATLQGAGGPNSFRQRVEPTQTVYSWVVDNHWVINYKADQEGPLTFRYALTAHGPYAGDAAARFGTGLSQPLVVREAVAPITPLLALSDAGVIATSLAPSDDGKALIVRLYGASGEDRRVTLTWRPDTVNGMWREPDATPGGARLGAGARAGERRRHPASRVEGPVNALFPAPGFAFHPRGHREHRGIIL